MAEEQKTSIALDAIALYFKRKYERECEESLALASALRDATQKNNELIMIANQLQAQVQQNLHQQNGGEPELPLTGEIIPPEVKPN
jgi:hypothetical protein